MRTQTMPDFKALLLDIEGTITSISFVKDKLFPYAYKNVKKYLSEHFDDENVQVVVNDLKRISEEENKTNKDLKVVRDSKEGCVDDLTYNIQYWIDMDKKLTPMKTLQGLIWEEAYKSGDVKGHVYPDVYPIIKKLKEDGVRIFIYSSGSVYAQKLLFSHSEIGDMTTLLDGYFDTNVGMKGDAESYKKISDEIGLSANEILFLSDVEKEVNAAKTSEMQAMIVVRPGNAEISDEAKNKYRIIHVLDEIL